MKYVRLHLLNPPVRSVLLDSNDWDDASQFSVVPVLVSKSITQHSMRAGCAARVSKKPARTNLRPVPGRVSVPVISIIQLIHVVTCQAGLTIAKTIAVKVQRLRKPSEHGGPARPHVPGSPGARSLRGRKTCESVSSCKKMLPKGSEAKVQFNQPLQKRATCQAHTTTAQCCGPQDWTWLQQAEAIFHPDQI